MKELQELKLDLSNLSEHVYRLGDSLWPHIFK